MSDNKNLPLMQQYYDIKKEHQDKIILFRMGDFMKHLTKMQRLPQRFWVSL